MQLKEHIIIGGTISLAIIPIFGIYSIFFWLASFLIDADHYLEFLYKNRFRDWSAKNMFKFFRLIWANAKERKDFIDMQVLHTAEAFIVIYLLGITTKQTIFEPIFIAVFWGMLSHIAVDLIWLTKMKVVFKRAFSITDYLVRKKLMIKDGMDPDKIFRRILKNYKKT